MMNFRVDLDFIGIGNAASAYGGKLQAWSFEDKDPLGWFHEFKADIIGNMRKKHLPVYRMADGEFRFLMGRKYNFHRRPLWREIAAVTAEKIRITNPDNWSTSWGETYSPEDTRKLRLQLVDDIRSVAAEGYLACYINDNGLNAFTEYNKHIEPYFSSKEIGFSSANFVPFHFVAALLVNDGWQELLADKTVLIVTGLTPEREEKIRSNLLGLGVRKCLFKEISATSSMYDHLDLSDLKEEIDLCLVAGGIGSAHVLRQLKPLETVCLDIGGFVNCLVDPYQEQHGGVFRLPKIAND